MSWIGGGNNDTDNNWVPYMVAAYVLLMVIAGAGEKLGWW